MKMFKSIFIILSLCACRGEKWDDKLTLPRQNYTGSELKVEGYYYNESDGSYHVLFFYRNGLVLDGGYPLVSEIESTEESYSDGTYYSSIRDIKTRWGIFVIEGGIIKYEYWIPSSGGPLESWRADGEILNDTTIRFSKSWRSCKPRKKTEYEQYFYFKKFSPKPDSTNSYTN
jgi:hypothetical protein